MNVRKPAAVAVLMCAVLGLSACGSEAKPAAAPAASSPAAGGQGTAPAASPTAGGGAQTSAPAAAPTASAGAGASKSAPANGGKPAADLQPCYSVEKQSDAKAQVIALDTSASPRVTAVLKITSTAAQDCVMYGGPDVRIENGAPVFSKLNTGQLGTGSFGSDKSHGVVLRKGASLFQPLAWWASPPAADTPNAACTTGTMLAVSTSEEAMVLDAPVKDLRVCPEKQEGSVQVRIGVPQASEADAKAQLKNAPK
ncbi:hypothetical protein ACIA8O_15960 [Kitasatospora sp. NPDC051853]|uniref:hypothetical protein n=1 Tax=Kitasatospora sp. NPDC051853 TaxID=3364058 RepID=UPI0037896CD9